MQHNRKKRSSSARAKSKASLAACSSEKFGATVLAKGLECKQLEDRVKNLQDKIEKSAVSAIEPLEKDLMIITSGPNLDSTPSHEVFLGTANSLVENKEDGPALSPNDTICTVNALQISFCILRA